ncbi:MAG: hypothetical protein IPI35_07660 [Deltaproteobacteria bacterium]|nr:hypothetical protein [Deltaproteobacteria bacterium]
MTPSALFLTLFACGRGPSLTVYAPDEIAADLARGLIAPLGDAEVNISTSPEDDARRGRGQTLALVGGLDCVECYSLEQSGAGEPVIARYDGVLGMQYALAETLERGGLRFFHPDATHVPEDWALPAEGTFTGEEVTPEIARRGLHLHTLHPIEGYYAMWEPGEANLERARAIVDWTARNRGNHLQWVALDNITETEGELAPWIEHSAAIADYAHSRGLTVGMGIQLFGSGNLQLAFDLLDEVGDAEAQELAMRGAWSPCDGVPLDLLNLSFGEFFGEEPEVFLDSVNRVLKVAREIDPEVELASVIHVGAEQRVEYNGQDVLYYTLAQFADPQIVPWVHSVMFYTLFDDAGGAYHHEEFDEHRELLLKKIQAGEPVGYFPESAYWVTFDNSGPNTPLYVWSRWRDIDQIRAVTGGLMPDAHVLFSSGWEWGYWQQDYATLRLTHTLTDWTDQIRHQWSPFGAEGEAAAALVIELVELQREALIEGRLAAWLASYDNVMELGYKLDIISQPKRPLPEEMAEMSAEELETLRQTVVEPLGVYAEDLAALDARAQSAFGASGDPWLQELADGFALNGARSAFIYHVTAGTVAGLTGGDPSADFAAAAQARAAGEVVIRRRHAALWSPYGETLLVEGRNDTIYQYGYLIRADELCLWDRELLLARKVLGESVGAIPGCSL